LELKVVKLELIEGCNIILGTAHFIKTVEDLYEALVNSVPGIKFGVAFCESSGPCLIRSEGNDEELREVAVRNALNLSCGHCFIIYLKNAYPINVLGRIRSVPEVTTVHASSANPIEVIIVETKQGRGILGIVDGFQSKGIETKEDIEKRKLFLREIGYKL
jgi:adenosine/AMP kinase